MKNLILTLVTLSCCISFCSNNQQAIAQTLKSDLHHCGVKEMPDYMKTWLSDFQKNPYKAKDGDDIMYLPCLFHLVGTDEGVGHFPALETYRLLCEVNSQYEGSGIQFYNAADFNYIDNTSYYDHGWGAGAAMMDNNNEPDVINIYMVDNPAGNCGYFSPGQDALAVAKSCADPGDATLAHELGHYLSMPHTFSGWEGSFELTEDDGYVMISSPPTWMQELVDGSNCATAGDGFCDTPADYISYRWSCPLAGESYEDPDGNPTNPDGSLIMSYSSDNCANRFSQEQIDAMIAFVYDYRTDLLGNPDPNIEQPGLSYIVYPAQNAKNVQADNVLMTWTAAPNAEQYYIEMLQFSDVEEGTQIKTFVEDTFYNVPALDPGITYYVSVLPLTSGNSCSSPTLSYFKTTGMDVPYVTEVSSSINACFGGENGSVSIEVEGGIPPYEYLWENGDTGPTLSDMESGYYPVTVTDSAGEDVVLTAYIPEPEELEINLYQTADLSATVRQIQGGFPPYTIEWEDGQSDMMANFDTEGMKTVTVSDANYCSVSASIYVLDLDIDDIGIECNGEDAEIGVEVNGGPGAYEYSWSNESTESSIEDLEVGQYELTITSDNEESVLVVLSFDVFNPLPMEAEITSSATNAFAEVTGGVPPYTYSWPTGESAVASAFGIDPGNYAMQIEDAHGCSITTFFSIFATGINETELLTPFSISPTVSDANTEIQVQLPQTDRNANSTIELIDLTGKVVATYAYSAQAVNDVQQIQVNDLPNGLYLVTWKQAELYASQKLIISR